MSWKPGIIILLTFYAFTSQSNLLCQTDRSARIWKGSNKYDGSIHALGNGKMLVYESGADIINMYPSPFSTPSLFHMEIIDNDDIVTASSREQGTAIWTHQLFKSGIPAGNIVDFVDSELPCLVRHFNLKETIVFRLNLSKYVQIISKSEQPDIKREKGNMLLLVNAGTIFYQKYAYPKPLYHRVAWQGNVKIEQNKNNTNEYILTLDKGESNLYFSGGPEYPQAITNSEEVQKSGYDKLSKRTRNYWKAFTAERFGFEDRLPANIPLRQKLLQTIDDVSVMLKTQQAVEGSVIAGYPYPLGYVRDQYGVSRGFLALGYFKEAKNILDFYWNIWKKSGEIHNAQGIGVDGVFHIHENDEVEIPGYLLIQAFNLSEKTRDDEFTMQIFPMLEWCWDIQKKHLIRGMLPFNGDETYVAGGFLPRSALNDGSAEATMLFIDGGEKLLAWIKKHEKWSSIKLENERKVLENTRNLFRENFFNNGQLITNNPERVNLSEMPRFRHGVCERSGPDCIVFNSKGLVGIDWTERDKNNRYQCPACLTSGPLPKVEPHAYNLISVSLTPLYMHSTMVNAEELKPMVEKVYSNYEKTGILSCIIDSAGAENNKRTVGYDFGFLLYSMLETGTAKAETIYRKTLAVSDSSGVWSEYYNHNIPQGTRYRPWESAINLEALIKFAFEYK